VGGTSPPFYGVAIVECPTSHINERQKIRAKGKKHTWKGCPWGPETRCMIASRVLEGPLCQSRTKMIKGRKERDVLFEESEEY